MFSVLFALAVDQWRTQRAQAQRADVALQSIRAELEDNLESVRRARTNHLAMRDSLLKYSARREMPPSHIYLGGIFNPALPHSTAWDSARETGAMGDLPYRLVLELSRVYDGQSRYRTLGDALVQDLMVQIRREGMEPVLRDRSASFIGLQEDFANRETSLIEAYGKVLASLNRR